MESAFGDQSYRKLPPIRKGSVKETAAKTATSNECNNSGFSRETHGLVRLPPIIRVDTTVRSPDMSDTLHDKIQEENLHSSRQADMKTDSHIVKLNKNSENLRNEDNGRRGEPTKGKIIQEAIATNNSNEFIRNSHLAHSDSQKVSPPFESNEKGQLFRRESKPVSLLSTNQNDYRRRRGSLIISETEKPLHRGRRLARSSPDLSSSRKQFNSPVREARRQEKTRIDLESLQGDFQKSTRLQRSKISDRNLTQRQSLKNRFEFPSQPQSSPCSPVIQLMDEPREQQRKSLGDIFSTSHRNKGLCKDTAKHPLMVEGKTCHQNERLTARVSSPRPSRDNLLRIPQSNTKRDSLYDLQQILSLLDKENKGSLPSDPRRKSTYDLKEFLDMSLSKQETATENLAVQGNKPAQTTVLLPTPEYEQAEHRGGSTHDLVEILSLNTKAKALELGKHDSKHKNVDDSTRFLFPTADTNTNADQRRTSSYDLMEFLSLSRQKEQSLMSENSSQPSKLQPPSLVLQPPTATTDTLATPPQDDSARKGSVYDLEEFLNLTRKSNSNLVTRVSDKDTGPQSSPLLPPRLPSRFKFKRESIYDLQEFLGVLQKESELKRISSGNDKEVNIDNTQPDICIKQPHSADTESLKHEEQHKNRSLSIYDLREFLSLYSAQSQTNVASHLRRKPSEISQSSIMINVSEDDFGNSCVDDVFLAVPVEGGVGRKRSSISSVAELNELINIINDTTRKKSSSDTPAPLSRHDSGGTKSLLDLGEFLSVLNSDDSPLRRRLSSVSDRGNRSPSSLSRNDSSGGSSLYDLEEFLAVINESGQLKSESDENENNEISIAVPQLPPRIDRNEQIDHQV